jgi:hypothetical protein
MNLTLKLQEALNRVLAFEPRYDFFVSYSRRDGAYYATALVRLLKEAGLRCFVDNPTPIPEQGMPEIREALQKSRFFILIGTEWAHRSDYVRLELNEFTKMGKPIVLIDFGGPLEKPEWLPTYGFARISEPLEALREGHPSKPVVDVLSRTPKSDWLTRISSALRSLLPQKRKRFGIFISYRTLDTAGYALWLYEKLKSKFWFRPIFLDVVTINGGQDWDSEIKRGLSRSRVLTALIGEAWMTMKDERGRLLLHKPDDYVRFEIATALNEDLSVIPVLLEGAKMPQQKELPPDMSSLGRKQPIIIRSRVAPDDVKVLLRAVKLGLKKQRS